MKRITILMLTVNLCFALVINGQEYGEDAIRGIYGNPKPLWDQGFNLTDLGVNAIFVHSGSINAEMIDRAKREGLLIFAEFATLNGKNYVENNPEAWAINEKGEKVEAASWFMGVCPTEPGFRQYRMDLLQDLLLTYDLDGIWMDYMHWHAQFEDPEPILPETCFCDHCLQTFSKISEIKLPNGTVAEKAKWILENQEKEWRDWRCEIIYDWAVEISSIMKDIAPDALLGLYHCPWTDQEFGGARRRILGLDYDLLVDVIDVFSPMVYHKRMGRKPEWVKENLAWFHQRLKEDDKGFPLVWPIVQASNEPAIISAQEFEEVLLGGAAGRSTGVMMFTTYAVAAEKAKIEVVRRVYSLRN